MTAYCVDRVDSTSGAQLTVGGDKGRTSKRRDSDGFFFRPRNVERGETIGSQDFLDCQSDKCFVFDYESMDRVSPLSGSTMSLNRRSSNVWQAMQTNGLGRTWLRS